MHTRAQLLLISYTCTVLVLYTREVHYASEDSSVKMQMQCSSEFEQIKQRQVDRVSVK